MIENEPWELVADRNRHRIYMQRWRAHPNCDDPEHPGCWQCQEEDFDGRSKDDQDL